METKTRTGSNSRSCILLTGASLLVALLGAGACGSRIEEPAEVSETLVSVLPMADPHAARQLLTGFYGVENGSWRWTKGKFAVLLRAPANAGQTGATLKGEFSVPSVALQNTRELNLSARVGSTDLGSQKITQAGGVVYQKGVPASAFSGTSVRIEFQLDHVVPPAPPGQGDQRELGLVAKLIRLDPK